VVVSLISDTMPPAAVTNLAAGSPTSSSLTLTWTAPGDDGSSGTATQYDIRYSTSSINEGNWASATPATGEPTPLPAGTPQTCTISGLNANTSYYFALKTADEVPNWSDISNSPNRTTSSAPSSVTLRPNAAGDYTNLPSQYPASGSHYDKVNEASPDGLTTYVLDGALAQSKDSYNLENATIPSGSTISSVIVYYRIQNTALSTYYATPGLRLGTSETMGTESTGTGTWVTLNQTLAKPGGGSWSQSDLDALQVIIGLRNPTSGSTYCTQLYVVVEYVSGSP